MVKVKFTMNDGKEIIVDNVKAYNIDDVCKILDGSYGEGFICCGTIAFKKKNVDYVELVGESE